VPLPFGSGINLLAPARLFDPATPEWIDQPGIDPAMVREELQVLEDANRRFGGHGLALYYVKRLVNATKGRPVTILDLGTGAADIPRTIIAWSRQNKLPILVTAIDRNPNVLRVARENCRDWTEIQFEQHDVLALPFEPKRFDIVLCSLALHHFSPVEAVSILRRMQDIARVGYILNDLRRNWLSVLITEVLARTVIQSPIARHDAPQSCRAAFTIPELHTLAQQAGLNNFSIRRHHAMFRMVLEGRN
jgi:2-polyprenyl-3-methyl-5-hydroxy-6-metoxy-1,4-benzoquinol methylase